jgi:hypothetical protein
MNTIFFFLGLFLVLLLFYKRKELNREGEKG